MIMLRLFASKLIPLRNRWMSSHGPLHGIKILDLTRVLAGPFATQLLGDMGAEVIKIETPNGGDDTRAWGPPFVSGEAAYFLGLNRNKKSVVVNLKEHDGIDLVRGLAAKADILFENFVPGKADELGIGYEALSALNPGLIYCSLSGYGDTGPYRDRLGYDVVVSAEGGLMGITGERGGGPVKAGVALTDVCTGLFLHGAALAALHARRASPTGRGQRVSTSLLEAQAAMLVNAASSYLLGGVDGQRWGTAHPSIVPYQAFATSDGHVLVAAGNDAQFVKLCARLGRPELANDERYRTNAQRVKHREELIALLSSEFVHQSTAAWLTQLGEGRYFPCAPINTIRQVFDQHPQLAHLGMVQTLTHPTAGPLRLVRAPVRFSETPTEMRLPPPRLGEHTLSVLADPAWLGMDPQRLAELQQRGVLGSATSDNTSAAAKSPAEQVTAEKDAKK